jgi:hypothetical protein
MSEHRGRIDWPALLWGAVIVALVVLIAIGVLAVVAVAIAWVFT